MANTQVSSLLGSIPFLRPYLTLRSYDVVMVVPDGAQLESVLGHVAAGRIRAVIDQNFSLPKAAEASLHLEGGHVTGKVVLEMGQEALKRHG